MSFISKHSTRVGSVMYLEKMLLKYEVEKKIWGWVKENVFFFFFLEKIEVIVFYRSSHNLEIVHTSGNYILIDILRNIIIV